MINVDFGTLATLPQQTKNLKDFHNSNVHILLWTYKEAKKNWLLDDFWLDCVTLTCHDMSFYGQDIVLKWYEIPGYKILMSGYKILMSSYDI